MSATASEIQIEKKLVSKLTAVMSDDDDEVDELMDEHRINEQIMMSK